MFPSASRRNLLKLIGLTSILTPALAGAALPSASIRQGSLADLNSSRLSELTQQFLGRHVNSSGVFTDSYQGVTHTEGVGVSMLFCAWLRDWSKFERMYRKLQFHKRSDGLYSWKSSNGRILDENNASDGELYILWALLCAKTRGAPLAWLQSQITSLEETVVNQLLSKTNHGLILKPGVNGFIDSRGIHTVNLSYVLLPLVNELSKSGSFQKEWSELQQTYLSMTAYAYFGDYGLPADWTDLTDPVAPTSKPELTTRFSYDAVRVPLFLMWAGHKSHPAVRRVKSFYEKTGRSWVDLRTGELSPYGLNPAQKNLLQWMNGKPVEVDSLAADYYQASLQILTLAASLGIVL